MTLMGAIARETGNTQILEFDNIAAIKQSHSFGEAVEYLCKLIVPSVSCDNEVSSDTEFMTAVQNFTEQNFSNPDYDLTFLAEKFSYSKVYIGRKFKSIFKVDFSKYLVEFRIERACRMLETTRARVADISESCGFRTSSYFVSQFKKHKNITPQEWRNKSRQ